jgi:broad specificity phosphatase PhoE
MAKKLVIKLLRHGESEANIGQTDPRQVGDSNIRLTLRGRRQARAAGKRIGSDFLDGALVYSSPYTRTRETRHYALLGAGLDPDDIKVYEDPRLREIEIGYADSEEQLEMRRTHGFFYYRFDGGESAADGFDRLSTFLESMMRQVKRKKSKRALIVAHGFAIRVFIMRFFHLTVEEFLQLDNPDNCDVITIAHKKTLKNPQFTSGKWGVEGLRFREPNAPINGDVLGRKPQ